MRDEEFLGIVDLYGIIAEMRTPLLEIKLLAQAQQTDDCQQVAKQTLDLFDSFLYAQQIEQIELPVPTPHSLQAATEDVLHELTPFAKLYGVKIDFKNQKKYKKGVSLVRQAFDHATRSLLHTLISALQNQKKPVLKIEISYQNLPTLKFFSDNANLLNPLKTNRIKSKINPKVSGINCGLLLANLIYRQMGSKLSLVKGHQKKGFWVDFQIARQMSLAEGLI